MALASFALSAPLAAQDTGFSYADYANAVTQTLLRSWYDEGRWRLCSTNECAKRNQDWGADALTYDLYLRWETTHDDALKPYFAALTATAPHYGEPCRTTACGQWSDVPSWDALAALRDYAVTGEPLALEKAKAAYRMVDASPVYAAGACPEIRYQLPYGGENKLKTLETGSNAIRAALLLYSVTHERSYLERAIANYAGVRRYFLDDEVPLYTVYVFDDGEACRQLPHRFFGSVNGNMIVAGLDLYAATGDERYRDQAIETAHAVDDDLSDARGVYANLQAENDVSEPLIEGMYALATRADQSFARAWLLRNADAAIGARAYDGSYGRFFDGPAPGGIVTAWQTNGAFALMIAAAQLDPERTPDEPLWQSASYVVKDVRSLPLTIRFTGSAIALFGTLGEHCCEAGHARIFVDGRETFDRSGIWQNKSCSGMAIGRAVLFSWQWPEDGEHVVTIEPATHNAKEGGAFLHLQGYLVR